MTPEGPNADAPGPRIGRIIPGYAIPVVDERAVRAAAGILFLMGAATFATAYFTGSPSPSARSA